MGRPINFVPAPRKPDGCPVCPPQTFFSGESEQIIITLVSLIVIGVVTITPAQLGYLLEGIDWRMPQHTWRPQAAG